MRSPEEEAGYTFVVYEQLRNLLDAIGDRPEVRRAVLYDNAAALYQRPGACLLYTSSTRTWIGENEGEEVLASTVSDGITPSPRFPMNFRRAQRKH